MSGRVSGKVAIVTGAARGLGAAFARILAAEGAKVVLTDLLEKDGAAVAEQLGGQARFIRHDVAKDSDWQQVVESTEAAFGPVSVLVNNAAILGATDPIKDLSEEDYRRVVDVNQTSVFLGMKAVIGSMRRADGGSIINISSTSGLRGVPLSLAYTASKFAVRGMTKVAAQEFARYKVRVNSVHPGVFRTTMGALRDDGERQLKAMLPAIPAERFGEPEELAHMVLLLASDEMRYATGAEFVVDGGMTCR